MRQHAGQNGTIIRTILVGRLMLLRSRVLVDQCHLAAASSHRAAASLAAVSLTHKGTDRSITSAHSHSQRSNTHKVRIWAIISRNLKGNASSVVVLAIKPRSVN